MGSAPQYTRRRFRQHKQRKVAAGLEQPHPVAAPVERRQRFPVDR